MKKNNSSDSEPTMRSFLEQAQSTLNHLATLFVKSIPSIQVFLENVEYLEQEFPSDLQEVFKACSFPPSSRLSLNDYADLVKAFAEGGAVKATPLLIKEYRALVEYGTVRQKMLADWETNPLLERRMPILREALKAASDKLYNLAVPVFVANLEGVLADARVEPEPGHLNYKSEVSSAADGDWLLGPSMQQFITDVVLKGFTLGDEVPEFSRHAMMHGADTTYGTEENTIRAVALFDYLQAVLCRAQREL